MSISRVELIDILTVVSFLVHAEREIHQSEKKVLFATFKAVGITPEEQAKMNYWAFSAMGADHPYLEDEIVDEMSGRTPLPELPHFKQVLPPGWRPNVGGVWQYYTRIVTENPDAAPTIHRP